MPSLQFADVQLCFPEVTCQDVTAPGNAIAQITSYEGEVIFLWIAMDQWSDFFLVVKLLY